MEVTHPIHQRHRPVHFLTDEISVTTPSCPTWSKAPPSRSGSSPPSTEKSFEVACEEEVNLLKGNKTGFRTVSSWFYQTLANNLTSPCYSKNIRYSANTRVRIVSQIMVQYATRT